jgi:hypothetical protein
VRSAPALALLLLVPAPASGWGALGHRVVARVAQPRLDARAQAGTRALLGGATLADVSTWADDVRDSRPATKRWHYVNVPRRAAEYETRRDCALRAEGDCVVAAIARERRLLADLGTPRRVRIEALRFVIHLVPDAHQPLHCADDGDAGGNRVEVRLLGRPTNLHAAWDGGLLAAAGLREAELVRRLGNWLDGLGSHRRAELAAGSVEDWVDECHAVAVTQVYGRLPPDRQLGWAYVRAMRPAIERQLARAAIRLARVLNQAFAP